MKFNPTSMLAAATVAAVIGALAWGEWVGWPFLAAPLERALSATLDRRVSVAAAADAGTPGARGFSVRFFGRVRLVASQLEIAAPAWSEAPHLLRARDVTLDLRYIDLWRAHRGQPLHLERLSARSLDASVERLADGRASWQFGPERTTDDAAVQPMPFPRWGQMQIANGTLHYRDVPLGIDVIARMSLADGEAPAFRLSATGHYGQMPLKIEMVSAGLLPWVATETPHKAVALSVNASVGRANLTFKGSAQEARRLTGLAGRFRVTGPSLAAVGDPFGVTLPTTTAFRSDGDIAKQDDTWRVVIDDATVGASHLSGTFRYDAGRSVPLLSGRLSGRKLMLADLGPVIGTTAVPAATMPAARPASVAAASIARGPGKVLPARPFDLASLRTMDADVQVELTEVDLNTEHLEPLRPLRGHLILAGGVLTLGELDARTGQGRLMGELRLDGREATALWNANLRWDGVQLSHWVRQVRTKGLPPYVSGRLLGRALLQGRGRSTADILASLKGTLYTELREGSISHLVIEAAGLDVAQGLGVLFKGDDALPVQCAVAELMATGGVFVPKMMVLDTSDSAVWVDGSVSLAAESIDLRVVVVPKDFSPLTLRTPLRVRGSFAKPVVSLDKAPMARKLATSFLLALVNPLAALVPLLDPGDSGAATRGAAGCRDLTERAAMRRAPVASPPR